MESCGRDLVKGNAGAKSLHFFVAEVYFRGVAMSSFDDIEMMIISPLES